MLFGRIWPFGLFIDFCWDPLKTSFGPKWNFKHFLPPQQKTLSKPIWANSVFIPFFSNLFNTSIWTYLAFWAFCQLLLGPLKNVIRTKMEFWAFYAHSTKNPFKAYLGQFDFYTILCEPVQHAYLGLSGFLGFVTNLVEFFLTHHLGQNEISSIFGRLNKNHFQSLFGPTPFL